MALQKRWGPTRAPGVVIEERPGEAPIQPAALGTTAYVGMLERGPVGELITLTSKKDLARRTGGLIPESEVPLCARHFYDLGRGAGSLHLVRVTDGSEEAASVVLFDRADPARPAVRVACANGGRWGGKAALLVGEVASTNDIGTTTINLPATQKPDRWRGARLRLLGVPERSYVVEGNTQTTLTVDADSDLAGDLSAGSDPTNKGFALELDNAGKELAVIVSDDPQQPNERWGLAVHVDGEVLLRFEDLSSDPASPRYFVDVVNQADGNDLIRLEDLRAGAPTSQARPVSFGGTVQSASTGMLMVQPWETVPATGNAGNGTVSQVSLQSDSREDRLTLTVSSATTPGSETWSVTSQLFGSLPTATTGQSYDAPHDYGAGLTIQAGATPFAVGDTITLYVRPLPMDALKGGTLYPDQDDTRTRLRIAGNSAEMIQVAGGADLASYTSPGRRWRAEAPRACAGGIDGHAAVTDADYMAVLDVAASPLDELAGGGYGLVKLATPGITSPAVTRAGVELAEARNWQFRLEVPPETVTEGGAEQFVDGAGRSAFAVVTFPSYATVTDPVTGARKLASLTGAIHGREALVARDFQGFHKAAAGIEVTLPVVLALPTGRRPLDLERLNPRGINTLRFANGRTVLWGDRTLAVEPSWRFKHQRELMSHYENTLREAFEFIVFAINDRAAQQQVLTSLRSFFVPEFAKRAVRGASFEEAVQLKVDAENNTNATRDAGELHAEITLRLADTVERFVISIGKAGIFESVAR